jgi:hypothetical protein
MRNIFAVALLAVTAPAFAIQLRSSSFVPNEGGYCTWASLDTLGRHHDLHYVKGLLQRRRNWVRTAIDPGYTSAVKAQLDVLNVDYILHDDGAFDRAALTKYTKSHGCVVTLMAGSGFGCHSVVLCEYDERVTFFDPNSKRLWHGTKAWFDTYWSGNMVVLLGEKSLTGQPTTPVESSSGVDRDPKMKASSNVCLIGRLAFILPA